MLHLTQTSVCSQMLTLVFANMSPAQSARKGRGQRIDLDPRAVTWLRETRGLSLRGLARAAEISPGYLHNLESGYRGATEKVLDQLAAALDCPRSMLLRKDDDQDEGVVTS